MAEQALETTITNPELAGEAMAGTDAPQQAERQIPDPKPADKHGWWWGTGRRKTSVARVRLRPAKDGQGKVLVQSSRKKLKEVDEYFSELRDRKDAKAALALTETLGNLEVYARLSGGGYMGQAQAMRLGVARALVGYDPSFEPALRDAGYLTRDARKIERKKYGQPGARRRFQFSKR